MPYKNKEDQRAYAKKHYQENKKTYKKKAKKHKKKMANKHRILIFDYLLDNPCVDCGEKDPRVLTFDHKSGVEKRGNVADSITSG